MSYKVLAIPPFDKQIKRLAKKYPSLKSEFGALIEALEREPRRGTSLGKNCYKIRLAIKSKGAGKRGGARIITNVLVAQTTVYLLTIFDKTDKANLTDTELKELLQYVPID